MRKPRIAPQLSLPLRRKDKNEQWRGGARPGAGRPKKSWRASERHKERPKLSGRKPILVTVRVAPEVGSLRRHRVYRAIRHALDRTALKSDFRVVHISLQRTHAHLLVEADDKAALSKGMQGMLISAAKRINREIARGQMTKRRGCVFSDRYHARILDTPRECRNALAYVLNNWRRHREDRGRGVKLDPFSSAANFGGWRGLGDSPFLYAVENADERLLTCAPRTWLLRLGWKKHGAIGEWEVPRGESG